MLPEKNLNMKKYLKFLKHNVAISRKSWGRRITSELLSRYFYANLWQALLTNPVAGNKL